MVEKVTAPIMGTIVSVKVKAGDRVKQGDVLLILEAMKMENEIYAPKSGVVKEVHTSEGKPVKHGDILMVIE